MSSRGADETKRLQGNLLEQQERLLTQLQDLQDCRCCHTLCLLRPDLTCRSTDQHTTVLFRLLTHTHTLSLAYRDDMDAEEYDVMRRETEEQLSEVRASLARMQSGDMTLVNERNESQLVSAHMYARTLWHALSWQPPTHTHTPARTHTIRKRVKAKKIRVGLRVSAHHSLSLFFFATFSLRL